MVGGASGASISWRRRAAQARALREHGIDPRRIAIGRSFSIGRHHSIFRLISMSSTTRKNVRLLTVAVVVPENLNPMEHP
jgi:hypothetical protein